MIVWLAFALPTFSDAASRETQCRFTDGPIVVDGRADEPAWRHATVVDEFRIPWLKGAPRAKAATKARMLWDRENLYVAAELVDAEVGAGDAFEVIIRPAADKPGFFRFQLNADGSNSAAFQKSMNAPNSTGLRWQASVGRTGTGWALEGRIAWTDLASAGGRPEPGETWRINLARRDFSKAAPPELSTCAPLRRPALDAIDEFTTLRFIGPGDSPGTAASRIPARPKLTTSRVVGSPDPPPPFRVKRIYPKLKINYPIIVRKQPNAPVLWFVTEPSPYEPTALCRCVDSQDAEKHEVLLPVRKSMYYDIVFHPNFAKNGYVYLGTNEPRPKDGVQATRIIRYHVDPNPPHRFDEKSATCIIDWPSNGHNGGAAAFGPDGMMYVTSGDGTADSDRDVVGQDLSKYTSKVLRIDVDHADPGRMYSVPKDNPFVGWKDALPETWAYGFRNPWRMTFDQKTGHLWVGQNGQDLWEQAYFVRKGENYGWSVMEGGHPFYIHRKRGPTPIVPPTIDHPHSEFRSLTGGVVYYGKRFPELVGVYIYGDYSTGKIWGAKHDGTKLTFHKELASTRLQIAGFGVDADGEVIICDHHGDFKGGFFTFERTPPESGPSTFPRKLSDSGLFSSVKGHVVAPGVVPYSVNAPFWSDGAIKDRYIAVPGDARIDYTRNKTWGMPVGTVVIKSFQLEMNEGDPASRKWIETRFLTNQQGEWYGYSYLWNEEQTDAELVVAAGLDRTFAIQTAKSKESPDGVRRQQWRYPSRSECMACHSRAANFALGLCERQLNRNVEVEGTKISQLDAFERWNLLKVGWKEESAAGSPQTDQRQAAPSALLSFQPQKYERFVDPYDPAANLEQRARAFLHSNCSHCHVEAGGGNARMELEIGTALDRMNIIDVKPLHNTFGMPDARLVAPGHPERSVLLHRISHRGEGHMPPLSTYVVDKKAVDMLAEWIRKMPEAKK